MRAALTDATINQPECIMTNGYLPEGWYADPTDPGGARCWNGVSGTEVVSRGGIALDASIDPAQAPKEGG